MIISDEPTQPEVTAIPPLSAETVSSAPRPLPWLRILLSLLLTCAGASWFLYQLMLVPQPTRFMPDWHGAHWVQAADGDGPLTYFRYAYQLNTFPESAFITLAASQSFEVYVNNAFVGSNIADVGQSSGQHAYMYDILTGLRPGHNVIAISVANFDQRAPALIASVALIQAGQATYYGSGSNWQATSHSDKANSRYTLASKQLWTASGFDASGWQSARKVTVAPMLPLLTTNPVLYAQSLPTHWLNAGSGHEAYFVREIDVPAELSDSWLRIVATGPAHLFINGNLITTWNGQAALLQQRISRYLGHIEKTSQYQNDLVLGIYDITPYLHAGMNTLAVHVEAPGNATSREGLGMLNTALLLDMLSCDHHGHDIWFGEDTGWHASNRPVDGWIQGSKVSLQWPAPFAIGRPGMLHAIYLPESPSNRNVEVFPWLPCLLIILGSALAVCGLWLLISFGVTRLYYCSLKQALSLFSLAALPALAFEALLIVLARETQLPQPFPYTWQWGLLLAALVGLGYLTFFLIAYYNYGRPDVSVDKTIVTSLSLAMWDGVGAALASSTARRGSQESFFKVNLPTFMRGAERDTYVHGNVGSRLLALKDRLFAWLRNHWGLVLLMLVATPLICYGLSYEPYWQDELTSYFAAKGVLATGLPVLPSGFLYTKGELYSYLLALSIVIFGEQGGNLRFISVAAYLISLPLCYGVGCYFFKRKIALLATATLAFSPFALQWGRAVRMYELAQVFVLLAMYLFFKALEERNRARPIYLAVASLILAYLSHEEVFIILPALLLCSMVFSRAATHRLPTVLYQKHWWIASAIGASIIIGQLIIARVSHPPILGTDQSQQPMIQLTLENVPYYFKLLFLPTVLSYTQPLITVNSLLAVIGCIVALCRGDQRARYCALFLIVSMGTLVLVFTSIADRYIYTLLPVYYLIGAYALLTGLQAIWRPTWMRFIRVHRSGEMPEVLNFMAKGTIMLVCVSLVLIPIMPISSYSLFLSKQAGFPYHRHYPDYDDAAAYIHSHWQKGDVVVAVSPAISILYYVGRVNYFFSIDRALYLFEKNGAITDTPTGSRPLLSQEDFTAVLASHARIWVITDNGSYRTAIRKTKHFIFPPDLQIVYRGYGSIVYLRDG